jgi:murein L,D-transpeptidase YcbB/YkuD
MRHRLLKIFLGCSSVALLSSCAHMPSNTLPSASQPNTTNKMAQHIYDVLPVYAKASKMSWKPIQMELPVKVGRQDNHIPVIRERLIALQDLPAGDAKSTVYDASLAHAVAQFQSRNNLKSTGVIDQATFNALNITPATRYRELVRSMNEWAKYPQDANSRYIQVNIPSYSLQLIANGDDILQMKVIVGRPSRPTPQLSSKITTVVFNPTWTVPKTILAQDVIPGMRSNPHYLKEHYDMRVYASYSKEAPEVNPASIDWQNASLSNFNYRVTAPASDTNPLGRVKFIFQNSEDIYMHDTPEKGLFSLSDRARSSGCIRLENPMALLTYFYVDNSDLNGELVNQYLSTYQTKYIQLKNPMPIYITYILAWVGPHGHAHFGDNVYGQN